MLINHRRVGRSLLAGAAAICWVAAPAAAAGSAVPPDPSARGYIALCDLAGHDVAGGSVNSAPLVWKAVSSAAAPAAFRGRGENAALYIYQVRRDTPPGDWSGDSLSADSFYDNRRHPATQLTYSDLSLADVIQEFPPLYDGLYQLRMHVGKLNYATYSTTYPSTFIKVTGATWHVVQGGTEPCGASTTAKSAELYAGKSLVAPTPDKHQTPPTAPATVRLTNARSSEQDEATGGGSHAAVYTAGGLAVAVVIACCGGMIVRRLQ